MSNNYTFAGISIDVANTNSHIPLVTRSGRQATWLAQFNQGTHFYYKIQLQLQIIRILLQGIISL